MKQKGQALLEFAFVAPILVFMFLSILYLCIMFMEYTQYSNAARDAARDISLQVATGGKTAAEARDEIVNNLNRPELDGGKTLRRYVSPLTHLYKPTWLVYYLKDDGTETTEAANDAVDVKVSVSLTRGDLPTLFEKLNFLPRNFRAIIYTMKLET